MVDHIERPVTPPQRSVDTSTLQVTPEHVRQIEINRLKGI
jgi:DNA-repair protein complementing XP-A cells